MGAEQTAVLIDLTAGTEQVSLGAGGSGQLWEDWRCCRLSGTGCDSVLCEGLGGAQGKMSGFAGFLAEKTAPAPS